MNRPARIAGVVIERWKLAVFQRHLEAAGREYTVHPGLTPDLLLLKVLFTEASLTALVPVLQAAQQECAGSECTA